MILANKIIVSILSISAAVIPVAGSISIFKDKIDLAKENSILMDSIKVIQKERNEFKFDIDSVRGIAKIDTAAIYKRGYEQAKIDKACSYFYSDENLTVTMGEGNCKYFYVKEIFNSQKKTVSGGGKIKDSSIHIK